MDVKKHAEAIQETVTQFLSGVTSTGGKSGGFVDVKIDKPLPGQKNFIRARCASDCPPGAVQLIRTDKNEWFAVSQLNPVSSNPQSKLEVSRKRYVPSESLPGGLILCTFNQTSWHSDYFSGGLGWNPYSSLPTSFSIDPLTYTMDDLNNHSALALASWICQLLGVTNRHKSPSIKIPDFYYNTEGGKQWSFWNWNQYLCLDRWHSEYRDYAYATGWDDLYVKDKYGNLKKDQKTGKLVPVEPLKKIGVHYPYNFFASGAGGLVYSLTGDLAIEKALSLYEIQCVNLGQSNAIRYDNPRRQGFNDSNGFSYLSDFSKENLRKFDALILYSWIGPFSSYNFEYQSVYAEYDIIPFMGEDLLTALQCKKNDFPLSEQKAFQYGNADRFSRNWLPKINDFPLGITDTYLKPDESITSQVDPQWLSNLKWYLNSLKRPIIILSSGHPRMAKGANFLMNALGSPWRIRETFPVVTVGGSRVELRYDREGYAYAVNIPGGRSCSPSCSLPLTSSLPVYIPFGNSEEHHQLNRMDMFTLDYQKYYPKYHRKYIDFDKCSFNPKVKFRNGRLLSATIPVYIDSTFKTEIVNVSTEHKLLISDIDKSCQMTHAPLSDIKSWVSS